MPEGHTIHRIAQDHERDFAGQKLAVRSPQGRFAVGAKILDGQRLNRVEAHGKHLCYRWEKGKLLHIHLGLYGKFRPQRLPVPEPRGQVRMRVISSRKAFDLSGPSACELVSEQAWSAIQARLGADPLRRDADPQFAWQRIRRSRAAIGSLLLNQAVIAGVGNVYRSEALHVLGIHPERSGQSLETTDFDRLWELLVKLLKIGVRYNRIIIADPADVGKSRSRMTQKERLLVYKRDTCQRCGGPIESWMLAARKVFACPRCQPLD